MDDLAFNLSKSVNEIHQKGFRKDSRIPDNLSGDKINFFEEVDEVSDASLNLKINKKILDDLENLVTSSAPGSAGVMKLL